MSGKFIPNDGQRRAINFGIDRPLKVVAGAGTGKTEVLARRFVRVVECHNISPFRMLALTFTKKAAAEMRKRIIDELLQRKLITQAERPLLLWIGNFHSICHRLLRQYALAAGIDPSFAVIEEIEQRRILSASVYDFLDKKVGADTDPDRFEDLMIERVDTFTDNMLRVIDHLKANFIAADDMKESIDRQLRERYRIVEETINVIIGDSKLHANTRNAAEKRLGLLEKQSVHESLLFDAAYEIYLAYQTRLQAQNFLDYNDLIFCTYNLAKTDRSLRDRFGYILVDEFQDTDTGQYKLLNALSDDFKNVTVVCDRKQCIYEWRDARIRNVYEFPGDTIHLDENYRSYAEILDSANSFIGHVMPEEKPLRPALDGGRGIAGTARVRTFRGVDQQEEAEYVAAETARLLEQEYGPEHIAVLMRSVHASRFYEDAFESLDVPYVTVGGCGFYDLSETRDLIALLRLISNPFDSLSMVRILQGPLVGLSDAALYELFRAKDNASGSVYETLRGPSEWMTNARAQTYEKARTVIEVIDGLITAHWSLTLGELISEVLNKTGYLKYLASIEGPRGSRFSNISLLYKKATLFEERNYSSTLEEFLAYLEDGIAAGEGEPVNIKANAVQIMTVHQAKGLEFPVVFVVNLKGETFPSKFRGDAFGYDEELGPFIRKLPDGKYSVRYKGGYRTDIEESLKKRQYGEENRVMYVAMTRARDLLYLTTSEQENQKGNNFFQRIEEFADTSEHPGVEQANFTALPDGLVLKRSPKTDDTLSVSDIKDATAKIVRRISASPRSPTSARADETIVLSYSQLVMFRECALKYALRYIYNIPLFPRENTPEHIQEDTSAFALGNLLHTALMHYHRQRKKGVSSGPLEILETMAQDCPKEILPTAKKILRRYAEHPLCEIDTLYEEQEFHWQIEHASPQIHFAGKIDRIHREGDSLKIVDYKTGTPDPKNHKLQLGIYRLAIQSALGVEQVRTSDFYLSRCEEVEHCFTEYELEEIREGIIRDVVKIADPAGIVEIRDQNESRNCASCEYASLCPHTSERP
jgi:DNA helicase-2/ATP-dependent DNA helicase PcrA